MKIRLKDLLIGTAVIGFTIGSIIIIVYPFFLSRESITKNIENYSALILSFLTFVYVLLTYFILRSNNKAVKEQLRPYVLVTFPIINGNINFTIQNIGKRPAYSVLIDITPGLEDFQIDYLKGNYKSFLKQSFIAPQQEIKCYLFHAGYLIGRKEQNKNKIYGVKISYQDNERFCYQDRYEIDLSSYVIEKDAAKNDSTHFLEEIQKEFNSLNKTIEKFIKEQK